MISKVVLVWFDVKMRDFGLKFLKFCEKCCAFCRSNYGVGGVRGGVDDQMDEYDVNYF